MAVSQMALGNMQVSRVVPGLMRLLQWDLSTAELIRWIQMCFELGINTFDHADIYGRYECEEYFGKALQQDPTLRDQMRLVTKCGIALLSENRRHHTVKHYNTTKEHILMSVNNSLRNFHTERIDLLLIHRPDPLMNADEVAAAFDELRASGKVLNFGVSNFLPHHFDLLASRLDFPLVTNQVELSLLHLDPLHDGTLDQCQRLYMPPMVWSPLGGGALFNHQDERALRIHTALVQVADEIGAVTPEQVALAWVLMHPSKPILVLGSGQIERIRSAVEAESVPMTRQQWFTLWQASAGHEVP